MHCEINQWFQYVKFILPQYFSNKEVLDVGALDVNGNNRWHFDNCSYTGLDVGAGPNVDVVSVCHEFDKPDASYDVVLSTDALEHDMHWKKSVEKMFRLVRPGGLLSFTCASEGRGEHGTRRADRAASPLTIEKEEWQDYYKNLDISDIKDILKVDDIFIRHEFSVIVGSLVPWGKDLRFWGIKR